MLDKILDNHLQLHAGKGTITIPTEVMDEYLSSCKQALEDIYKSYTSKFPTVSDLSGDVLKMWCRRNYPDVKEEFPATLHRTFWQGKVIEALLVAQLKLTDVKVMDEQARIYLDIDGAPDKVRGKIDLRVEHKDVKGIIDIKIAHTKSFEEKWKSHETLTASDAYGYNIQAASYELGLDEPFIGWLVFNKDTSELRFVPATDEQVPVVEFLRAAQRLVTSYGDRPELPTEPELYLGTPTGNTRVPPHWARSPYNKVLWPDAIRCTRGKQTIIYTDLKEIKIPGVKKKV